MPLDESVELRGPCPREVVDVLDAISQSKRITRMELVTRILKLWANERFNEAMLVQRVTRGNPVSKDSGYGSLE